MGVAGLWKLLRSQGLVTEYNGSEGQHPDIVQLVAGKVIAVDLSLWVFQARFEPNLRQNFTSESAACAKVAFERVRRHCILPC